MAWVQFLTMSFFFSSRRRHTMLVSDWSSDVCSSDLLCGQRQDHALDKAFHEVGCRSRSEERRVGKECSSRWPAAQTKKQERAAENPDDKQQPQHVEEDVKRAQHTRESLAGAMTTEIR